MGGPLIPKRAKLWSYYPAISSSDRETDGAKKKKILSRFEVEKKEAADRIKGLK